MSRLKAAALKILTIDSARLVEGGRVIPGSAENTYGAGAVRKGGILQLKRNITNGDNGGDKKVVF